jgi:putative membrane protein
LTIVGVRRAVTTLVWVWGVAPAAAHGPVAGGAAVGPNTLWRSWSYDPLVLAPLLLGFVLYWRGVARLRTRAGREHGVTSARAASCAAGAGTLFVALISPLDRLGETLLSAHMVQHGLLVAIAPPLLLIGNPGVVFAWGLPDAWRTAFLGSKVWRWIARLGDKLSRPLAAAALHGLALWLWHAPAAFDAAVASYGVHALEHASFFGTALIFWRAMLATRSRRSAAHALGAAFVTLLHGGLLGALITLARVPLYGSYHGRAALWGLSPLEDQQLAGLLMWVPMGVVYLGTCLMLASRLIVGSERAERVSLSRTSLTRSGPAATMP